MPTIAKKAIAKAPRISRDEEELAKLATDTEESLLEDLANDAATYGWGEVKGLKEKNLFDVQYNQLKQVALREAGLTAFKLYERYEPLVEAAVMHITSPDVGNENFLGVRATSDQFFIRQITTDTLGISAGDRVFATGGTGNIGIVERSTSAPTSGHTMSDDDQMMIVMYYQNNLNPRVLEELQEEVDDDIGKREVMEIQSQLSRGNEGIVTRPGALAVEDNKTYYCGAHALQNADFDLMPQGVEIVKSSTATGLGLP